MEPGVLSFAGNPEDIHRTSSAPGLRRRKRSPRNGLRVIQGQTTGRSSLDLGARSPHGEGPLGALVGDLAEPLCELPCMMLNVPEVVEMRLAARERQPVEA